MKHAARRHRLRCVGARRDDEGEVADLALDPDDDGGRPVRDPDFLGKGAAPEPRSRRTARAAPRRRRAFAGFGSSPSRRWLASVNRRSRAARSSVLPAASRRRARSGAARSRRRETPSATRGVLTDSAKVSQATVSSHFATSVWPGSGKRARSAPASARSRSSTSGPASAGKSPRTRRKASPS